MTIPIHSVPHEHRPTPAECVVCGPDSTLATLQHSRRVDVLMLQLVSALQDRLHCHDQSKMEYPEKETFDRFSARLRLSTYGSEEYKGFLRQMKPALDHHYANNRHHPEHHVDGIDGMTLIDLIEMLADWKAASERHENGDLRRSLAVQKDRFDIGDQLWLILRNTADEADWL